MIHLLVHATIQDFDFFVELFGADDELAAAAPAPPDFLFFFPPLDKKHDKT